MFKYNDGGRDKAGFKGKTGDCVCRAIAIATETDYNNVYYNIIRTQKAMIQSKKVRGSHPRMGINRKVYDRYLKNLGWKWTPTMKIGSGCRFRSEERRVGKECRSRWSPYH